MEALEDKLVVFTSRGNPSPFYQSFVAGGIRLDIRRLLPSDVIASHCPLSAKINRMSGNSVVSILTDGSG